MVKKRSCDKCGSECYHVKLKRLNDGLICPKCVKENRKKHRDFLRKEIICIRKRRTPEEMLADEKKIFKKQRPKDIPPKIKGSKKPKIISKQAYLYLTKDEKYILYKKLISRDLSGEQASKRIKEISIKMRELAIRLREEERQNKITIDEMNKKFIEGLEKYSN